MDARAGYLVAANEIRPRRSLRETVSVYSRLGNTKVYIQWIPGLVGWALIAHPFGLSTSEVVACMLYVLSCIAGAASGGALDHLQGFRDGIDQQTYGSETYGSTQALGGYQTKQDASIKPLVTGEITDPEALRFGVGAGVLGVVLGIGALLVAPHHPWWLLGMCVLCIFASSQYSYGLKLSYYGPAELVLGLEVAAMVAFPVLFLQGTFSWTAAFQAYLIGTLFSQVTLFSMAFDKPADASAGRKTMAVRLSVRGYRIFLAAWILAGWAVAAVGFGSGALSTWLLLAWLPVWGMQLAQLVYGVGRERYLVARLLGWHAFNAALVSFVLVNLLSH